MIDIIHSANIMKIGSSTRPPPKKRLSTKQMLRLTRRQRAPPVCTRPACSGGQINSDVHASCWSAAKMNSRKKAFFVRARLVKPSEEFFRTQLVIPTEIPKIQQIWYVRYQQNTDTKKTAGNTVVLGTTNMLEWVHTTYKHQNNLLYACMHRNQHC